MSVSRGGVPVDVVLRIAWRGIKPLPTTGSPE